MTCKIVCFVFIAMAGVAAADPNPDYALEPPNVEGISVDRAKGKVFLELSGERSWPKSLTLKLNTDTLEFQKGVSGDGHQVYVSAASDALRVRLEADAAKEATIDTVPADLVVYQGRELVGFRSMQRARLLSLGATTAANSMGTPLQFRVPADLRVEPSKALLINEVSVVDDPRASGTGAWSFGGVMQRLAAANGIADAPGMVEAWLKQWATPQQVAGGDVVDPRPAVSELMTTENWPRDPNGKLDLAKSPFRLTAIVNRLDLRKSMLSGTQGDAGEGRFVYCLTDGKGNALKGGEAFLVIFEFSVKFTTLDEVRNWAVQWAKLSDLAFGPLFNNELQKITDQFVTLNQLRTNERRLVAAQNGVWELREFKLGPGGFSSDTVKRNPSRRYANSTDPANQMLLSKWVNANTLGILTENFEVPPIFDAKPFAGANALTPSPTFHWSGLDQKIDNTIVQKFSLNTCNGCHGGETHRGFGQTIAPFVHIAERDEGKAAVLSEFLRGTLLPDPRVNSTPREFNDLERRRLHVLTLLATEPLIELQQQPLNMVH